MLRLPAQGHYVQRPAQWDSVRDGAALCHAPADFDMEEGWPVPDGDRSTCGILYSVGYEGRTAEQLVELLEAHVVDVLVDVRLTPLSRKPGLSKRKLAQRLDESGIDYLHAPLLGNPADNREAFRSGRVQEGKDMFARRLANGSRRALLELVERARESRVAMLCVEADEDRCHRQVIAEAASLEDPTLLRIPI